MKYDHKKFKKLKLIFFSVASSQTKDSLSSEEIKVKGVSNHKI